MFQVNEYFDGQVKSLAFEDDTSTATIGVMAEGEYEFATAEREVMTVVTGILQVKLPEADEWQSFAAGESFEVAAEQRFSVRAVGQVAYLCRYG